ncbi:MAG: hypothetical protein ABJA67_07475 [Chthonomonadales bacterium]
MTKTFSYPKLTIRILLGMGLFIVGTGILFLLKPSMANSWGVGAMFIVVGGLNCGLAVWLSSRVIRVSHDAITCSDMFSSKSIAFDRITGVETVPRSNSSNVEHITVTDGQQTIMFTATILGYYELKRVLKERANPTAQIQGAAKLQVKLKKENRNVTWVALTFYTLLAGGFAGYNYVSANARIALYDNLRDAGQRTTGQITDWYISSGKSKTYILKYSFGIDGRSFDRASPVSKDRYNSTHKGEVVQVVYLLADPDSSTLVDSNGRELAESQKTSALVLGGIGVAISGYLWYKVIIGSKNTVAT